MTENYKETQIQRLMNCGFSREDAEEAIKNAERAKLIIPKRGNEK